jgi:hypothetical protein
MSWNPKPIEIDQPEVVVFHNRRQQKPQKQTIQKEDSKKEPDNRNVCI